MLETERLPNVCWIAGSSPAMTVEAKREFETKEASK